MSRKMVIGAYANVDDAYDVVNWLTSNGIPKMAISFVAGNSAQKYVTDITQPKNEQKQTLKGFSVPNSWTA